MRHCVGVVRCIVVSLLSLPSVSVMLCADWLFRYALVELMSESLALGAQAKLDGL